MSLRCLQPVLPSLLVLALLAGFATAPADVSAQLSSQAARKRYEKHTKGSSIEDYVRKLDSDDPEQRLDGVRSLAGSHNKDAIEYLVQALGDPDMRVKCKAIDGLADLRATEAAPVLIQHLFLRATEPAVKQRILAALGEIGDPRAAEPIAEFLQRDLDTAARGTAIFALGDLGSAKSLDLLRDIAKTDKNPTLQRLANEAIAKIQYHQAMIQSEVKEPPKNFLRDEGPPPKR